MSDTETKPEPHIADVPEEVPIVHCMPILDIHPHWETAVCWCSPTLNQRYPHTTGGEVWVHRLAQECYQ